jgi:hypothetical protein
VSQAPTPKNRKEPGGTPSLLPARGFGLVVVADSAEVGTGRPGEAAGEDLGSLCSALRAMDGLFSEVVCVWTGPFAPAAPTGLRLVHRPGLSGGAALALGLSQLSVPLVVLRADFASPSPELSTVFAEKTLRSDALVLGRSVGPAGVARSALDLLLLHVLPAEPGGEAPARWPTIPGAIPVLGPTHAFLGEGILDPAEADVGLAIEVAVSRLAARGFAIQREQRLSWSVPRRSTRTLREVVVRHVANRVGRLRRDPATALDPGWALASRDGLRRALDADPGGAEAEATFVQLGDLDLRPLLRLGPDWEKLAKELARRTLGLLGHVSSRWTLDGIALALAEADVPNVPGLFRDHPLHQTARPIALLPIDRLRSDQLDDLVLGAIAARSPGEALVVAMPAPGLAELEGRQPERLRSWWLQAALRDIELVVAPMEPGANGLLRAMAGVSRWVVAPHVQGESWGVLARAAGVGPIEPVVRRKTPIQTTRPVRLLAAPPWEDPLMFELFAAEVLGPLRGHPDVHLAVLRPPELRLGEAEALLARARASLSFEGMADDLELAFVDRVDEPALLARYGLAVHALVGPVGLELAGLLGAPRAPVEAVLALWEAGPGGA